MKMDTRYYCSLLLGYLLAGPCTAQSVKPDTAFLTLAKNNQVTLYTDFIHGQSRLYNGSEYRDYLSQDEEHPYFGVDDWAYGDIIYDDELYKNVPLFYDLSRDKVISEHLLNGAKLELVSEKIRRFSINGHTFTRRQKGGNGLAEDGFYDLLYDGRSKVIVRREKRLQQKVESNDIIEIFEEKNRLFVLKEETFVPVKNKSSVLDLFADRKQEVKSFMKKNNIKFKTERETAVVRVAEFYDTQNK